MKFPAPDPNVTLLAIDTRGRWWLLRWAVPHTADVWTALGYGHPNVYPTARILDRALNDISQPTMTTPVVVRAWRVATEAELFPTA
jgi:hypothetical protein